MYKNNIRNIINIDFTFFAILFKNSRNTTISCIKNVFSKLTFSYLIKITK